MRKVTIIDIFVSCPGDSLGGRNVIFRTADRLNVEYRSNNIPIHLHIIHCDNTAASNISPNVQDTISEQIGHYDLYIGLMWNRFGTPTGKFGSGTEQEFTEALKYYNNNNCQNIAFFFNEKDAIENNDQNNKVKNFRNSLITKGVLPKSYNSEDILSEEFRHTITNTISRIRKDNLLRDDINLVEYLNTIIQ